MQTIYLDFQVPGVPAVLHSKQNDSFSRFFKVVLLDGGTAYSVPSGAVFAIRYKNSASQGWYDTITLPNGSKHSAFSVSGNEITCELAEQCCAAAVSGAVCLIVYDATGYRIGGWNIVLDVEADPTADSAIEVSDYYSVLTAQVSQVLSGVAGASASALLAQSWAVGGTNSRPGEDTNNSKYWAEFAQSVAQGQKGYFATPEALEAAYPTGQDGWWAIVGTTDTIWLWDSDTSAWKNSGNSTDLSNYYTKSQSDTLLAGKLGVSATAADSAKLGGQLPAYYATKTGLENAEKLTANIEASTTASQAYGTGAYFVYGGLLYKVTAAIAQGGTIAPGTNCTATNTGAEITELNQALAPVLLWTNPSPDAGFIAQTVPIDLSGYTRVRIDVNISSGSGYYFSQEGNVGYNLYLQAGWNEFYARVAEVNNNGIVFGVGGKNQNTQDDGVIIPYKIYGLKY